MNRSFFAYHLTHVFGPFSLESYHTNSEAPTEGDLIYVVSGDRADDDGKDYWLEGLFRIHRRHEGPYPLKTISDEARDFKYRLSLIPVRMPPRPIEMRSLAWYDRKEVHKYFSSGQNFNPVKPDYQKRFDELLVQFGSVTDGVDEDLDELRNRGDLSPTSREVLAQARVGQGKFRNDLVVLWGRKEVCALTGIDVPELLIASHIKPWRESSDSERLDPCNGLLLAAHVDKAFDRYLCSFSEQGGDFYLSLHPRVLSAMKLAGVRANARLVVSHMNLSQSRRFSSFMADHYRRHLAGVHAFKPT